jgi:HSP20 family molecular chaperone IbpA
MDNQNEQLFSTLADAFRANIEEVAPLVRDTVNRLAPDVAAAVKAEKEALEMDLNTVPCNIFVDKNGDKIVEVAVPGKTKENVSVKVGGTLQKNTAAFRYLTANKVLPDATLLRIEVKAPVDADKEYAEARRKGIVRIKGMTSMTFSVPVENIYDLKNAKPKVENGLLTIRIPKKPEETPVELTIE